MTVEAQVSVTVLPAPEPETPNLINARFNQGYVLFTSSRGESTGSAISINGQSGEILGKS